MRRPPALHALVLALAFLAGCAKPGPSVKPGDVRVDFLDASLHSTVRPEGFSAPIDHGIFTAEVTLRNVTGRRLPCAWRVVFRDADGFEMKTSPNPWAAVVFEPDGQVTLRKRAHAAGARQATFFLREGAP